MGAASGAVALAMLVIGVQAAAAQSGGERGTRMELMLPPEYVSCRDVPQQLAEVDARMRAMGRSGRSKEGQFWMNRQERLIARAYICQED